MKSTFSPHPGHKMSLTRIFLGGVETIKLQLSWFWAYTVFQYFQIKPPLPSVWGCATRKWQCLFRYLRLSAHFSFRWVCHKPQEGGKGFHPASHTRHWALYVHLHACVLARPQRATSLAFFVPFMIFNPKQMITGGRKILSPWWVSGVIRKKKRKERRRRKRLWANSSSAATINLFRIEIHNNLAGRSQDLWLRNIHTDQHIPSFLAPSLPEWLSLTVTMINCLSLLFYKYISFI